MPATNGKRCGHCGSCDVAGLCRIYSFFRKFAVARADLELRDAIRAWFPFRARSRNGFPLSDRGKAQIKAAESLNASGVGEKPALVRRRQNRRPNDRGSIGMGHRVVKIRLRAISLVSLAVAISILLATFREGAGAAVRCGISARCR